MGGGTYNSSSRAVRATTMNYESAKKDLGTVFKQQAERKAHASMLPYGVVMRESANSADHPDVDSIILGLDVTQSMGSLPAELIADGLPTLMSKLIELRVDPSLLFLALTDHVYNKTPLQIGQFEANDETLDMWLTRTYIEGGGGGNNGESYMLAWYFGIYHTKMENFDKKGKKGFLITIGDEPVLGSIPGSAITEIFGNNLGEKAVYSSADLFKEVCKKFHVYHINIHHSEQAIRSQEGWDKLLGERSLVAKSVKDVAELIAKTVKNFHGDVYKAKTDTTTTETPGAATDTTVKPEEEYL